MELLTGIVRLQGSDEGNQHSVIEALATASLLQTPGARGDATTWCDESGHVWLFGGEGYDDSVSTAQPKLLDDLWLFNTSRLEWNVMHSSRIVSTFSTNNGTSTKSTPKPRKRAVSCGVPGIVFVVFGGIDSNGRSLSDTWIYIIPKARWLPLSRNGSHLAHDQTPWSTTASWCHLDALYVIGNSIGNVAEIWKFSLRTLEWTNESLYLTEQQHCANDSLLAAPANSISIVWNGTFYLYQWQIIHGDTDSNSPMLSINLQRWKSIPSTWFMNNWHSTPMLWSDLNSFDRGIITCSSPAVFQQLPHNCSDGSGQLCTLHRNYQIMSTASWPGQRRHTSTWFYEGNMYIFGGQAVVDDSKTFFNDLLMVKHLQKSDVASSSYSMLLVLSFVTVVVACILFGFTVFCILRYCDYRHGRKKSRELRVRYTPLRDQTLYEWCAL